LHCFVTGPLFLLATLATIAGAAGLIAIDWRCVLAFVAAGTAGSFGLEWLRGKYAGAQAATEREVS